MKVAEAAALLGKETAGTEGEDRVDDDTVLLRRQGQRSVETGPVYPEEDGTNHGEEVGGSTGPLLGVTGVVPLFILNTSAQNQRQNQAEIGTKGVYSHTTTHIDGQ